MTAEQRQVLTDRQGFQQTIDALEQILYKPLVLSSRKFYVWPKRGFMAVAFARNEEEARQLLLAEVRSDGSDGSLPCVTRACEAIQAHRPQVFGYSSTAEFVITDSGALEAEEKALAEVLHAAENLYAFAESSSELTIEGRRQVHAAFEVLRRNGSKMFTPSWLK